MASRLYLPTSRNYSIQAEKIIEKMQLNPFYSHYHIFWDITLLKFQAEKEKTWTLDIRNRYVLF